MRQPMMSGHCNFPATQLPGGAAAPPSLSHERCAAQGAGNWANPAREYQPCPCACHFPGEDLECECGGTLREAPHWPNEDEPGEMVYTHIDHKTGRATGENCS